MIHARRRCLAALGLAACHPAWPAWARPPVRAVWQPLRRWPTANLRLAPLEALDGRLLYAGERDVGLLDPDEAAPRWVRTHALPGGARFRLRSADGVVLCAGPGGLTAWSVDDGTPCWRRAAARQTGVPCVAGGRVFFGDGHELVAIDLKSGAEHWRFSAIADTRIAYAPAVAGDMVCVGPGDGRLYALDAGSGRLRWRVDRMREWQYLRQLHIAGDLLVAGGYKEKLYGLELTDGARRWEFAAGNFINSHHVADDLAYLWSPTGWLYAVDTEDGRVRWRHRTTDYRVAADNWAPILAELVVAEGRLYALDLSHALHVLDAASGRMLTRRQGVEPLAAFVLPLHEGRVVSANRSGEILLFAG